jgi:hypothetical protein
MNIRKDPWSGKQPEEQEENRCKNGDTINGIIVIATIARNFNLWWQCRTERFFGISSMKAP